MRHFTVFGHFLACVLCSVSSLVVRTPPFWCAFSVGAFPWSFFTDSSCRALVGSPRSPASVWKVSWSRVGLWCGSWYAQFHDENVYVRTMANEWKSQEDISAWLKSKNIYAEEDHKRKGLAEKMWEGEFRDVDAIGTDPAFLVSTLEIPGGTANKLVNKSKSSQGVCCLSPYSVLFLPFPPLPCLVSLCAWPPTRCPPVCPFRSLCCCLLRCWRGPPRPVAPSFRPLAVCLSLLSSVVPCTSHCVPLTRAPTCSCCCCDPVCVFALCSLLAVSSSLPRDASCTMCVSCSS
jgi:hypothetical protein